MATGTQTELAPHRVDLAIDRILILGVERGRYHAALYSSPSERSLVRHPTAEQFHWLRNRELLPQSQVTDWHRCAQSADELEIAVEGAMKDAYKHSEWRAVVGYIRSTGWGVDL